MLKKSYFNYSWFLFLSFLLGIVILGFLVFEVNVSIKNELKKRDEVSFKKASFILKEKINSYVHGLQGMNGVYLVSNFDPGRQLVHQFAKNRNFFNNFPGALGYGFIRRVDIQGLPKYLAKQKILSPDFKITKLTDQDFLDSYIIELIEPFEKNAQAIGLDVGSEPRRREAATSAMLSGEATLTAPIDLVQVNNSHPGFLYFLPLYNQPELPSRIEERQKKLVGWSYTPIDSLALIEFLEKSIDSHLIINLKDSNGDLIYKSSKDVDRRFKNPADWMHDTLSIGGRQWIMSGAIAPDSRYTFVDSASIVIFVLLTGIFILIFIKARKIILSKEASENKLEEVEGFSNAVLNGSAYAIISTFKDGTISSFNEAAQKMLGYKSHEMIGLQNPGIFHDPGEVRAMAKTLSEELGYEVPIGFETFAIMAAESSRPAAEWTYIRKDGVKFPVRLTVSVVKDRSNLVIGFVGVAEDLSQIKKMEETIEFQRAKIITAGKMAALGEMAAGVAHEINNPLAIVAGRAGILLSMVEEGEINKDLLKDGLSRIDANCLRIEKIIKGLRTFSRQASSDPMTLTEVSVIINDTLALCRERLIKNDVSLTVEGDLSAEILCRPVEISQVLLNLISNSIDAVSALQDKWIIIRVEKINKRCTISVKDSGFGILPQILDKMMQPFFTTKEVGKGTGLGLSISKGIIEAHKSELSYSLDQGHTRFEIKFSEESV